ncbi:uridine kinase [Aestuariimicrobium sp. Y1814]|uniref:uridine kinase n=1 Tax=Aestuariimicrobium sp. Y1814 TaxID=3418742 RepID=UPI003DA763F3
MSPEPSSCTIILVAGPSGSGKSRLSSQTGVPQVRLDDFYFDHDHPDLPVRSLPGGGSIVDWDDVRTWDLAGATSTLAGLSRTGSATVPNYDISRSQAFGSHQFNAAGSPAVICEGIFAIDLLAPLQQEGVPVEAIWLDRPRWFNFVRRLQRDLRQRRKPPSVLVRRGIALLRLEPALRRRALAAGFTPLGMAAAAAEVEGISRSRQPH